MNRINRIRKWQAAQQQPLTDKITWGTFFSDLLKTIEQEMDAEKSRKKRGH